MESVTAIGGRRSSAEPRTRPKENATARGGPSHGDVAGALSGCAGGSHFVRPDGKSSKQIGAALHVAVPTVETHRRQLKAKLGLHSVAELTKYAIRHGLLPGSHGRPLGTPAQ